jgi:hypothetical protein
MYPVLGTGRYTSIEHIKEIKNSKFLLKKTKIIY